MIPGAFVTTTSWLSIEVVIPLALLLMGLVYLYINNRRLARRLRKIALDKEDMSQIAKVAKANDARKQVLLDQYKSDENQLRGELESCQLALEFRTRQLAEIGDRVKLMEGNADLLRQIKQITMRERNNRFLTRLSHMAYISRSPFVKMVAGYFPKLTHSDLEILYWMKVGLDTKMISELSFRSTGSVKVQRSRLRRKLGMPINSPSILAHLDEITKGNDASGAPEWISDPEVAPAR